MAILDFLNKAKTEDFKSDKYEETFSPKTPPRRGPGGKFVSKKKAVVKKEIDKKGVQGPFMAPFAGKEIRKFYLNGKWYYSIEDLLFLISADPPIKPIKQLKDGEDFREIFKDKTERIGDVECADCKRSIEILRDIIKATNASFPGSLFRWLEDISTHKPEEVINIETDSGLSENSANPSDRGR